MFTLNYMSNVGLGTIPRGGTILSPKRLAHAVTVHTVTGDTIGSWGRGKAALTRFVTARRCCLQQLNRSAFLVHCGGFDPVRSLI